MSEPTPIFTSHLFPLLDAKLIELLRLLSENEWSRSALPRWTVKDIAAHLLDGNLRRLSMGRDGYWGEPFTGEPDGLTTFLHGLNDDWVRASRRLSPGVLIDLLESSGRQLSEYFASLDPLHPATFGVSWAGETTSLNWFDIAREYTEKWHHQQQIRDAVGRQGITTREFYSPVIATFLRVLPFSYRNFSAANGTQIRIYVTGECGGDWTLIRTGDLWTLSSQRSRSFAAEIEIPGELAWKLFTKGLTAEQIARAIRITGNAELAQPALRAKAIVG
jgi:uncharacterized protein (TIGR03083 family)